MGRLEANGTVFNEGDALNQEYDRVEGLHLFPNSTDIVNGTHADGVIVVRIVVKADGYADSLVTTSQPFVFDAEQAQRKRDAEEAARREAEEAARRKKEADDAARNATEAEARKRE